MKHVILYEVDSEGFRIETHIVEVDNDNNPVEDLLESVVPITPPNGLYKAKWTGSQWIEGATPSEIEEAKEPSPQSETQILGQQITDIEIESMVQGQQMTDLEIRLLLLEVGSNV